jgi:hypothetical protein
MSAGTAPPLAAGGLRALPATLPGAAAAFARFWSPWLLALACAGAWVARAGLGGLSGWDAAVALGVVAAWPLNEWWIHVFVLHYEPRRAFGRRLDFRVPSLHRAHHADPWRLDLVLIPLRVYLLLPLALGAIALLGGADSAPVWTGAGVYLLLSLHYEWVHFLVHTRYRPRTALYRRLWRNHRLHHFKNERYWYGVTMLSGDRLLGTAADRDAVPTSPTARTLGARPGAEF